MKVIDLYTAQDWQDLFYTDMPDKDRVFLFNKFLKENKMNFIRLYHGTSIKHNILEEGLKPTSNTRKKSLQSQNGYVYLSIFPTMAYTFGELAYPRDQIIVYKVDTLVSNLKADLDQLNNKRYWGSYDIGNTLGESLVYGHGARIKGGVDRSNLSIYK